MGFSNSFQGLFFILDKGKTPMGKRNHSCRLRGVEYVEFSGNNIVPAARLKVNWREYSCPRDFRKHVLWYRMLIAFSLQGVVNYKWPAIDPQCSRFLHSHSKTSNLWSGLIDWSYCLQLQLLY